MSNILEVQIISDISSLEKGFSEAKKLQDQYSASIGKLSGELKDSITVTNGYKKAIDDLNDEYKNGAISAKDYSKSLANLKRDEKESAIETANLRKELAKLKREQKDLGNSFQKGLTPKVANGGNALMQFSRIAQDAPYGIMGIGNNITATVEAFGHLQKSTGSAGSALKAMGASILGSGGILLAVSLLTSALTYMSQNNITVGDIIGKLTGKFNASRKAAQELNVEAVKGSAEQIATMNAYVGVASNVNLSMSDRLLAVKKLQSEYPAYFGNLSQEAILNGNVAGAVLGATQALIAKAKAAASVDKIVKLAEEEEILQNRINDEITRTAKAYKLTNKEAFEFAKILNKQLRGELDLFEEANQAGGSAAWADKAKQAALVALKTIPVYKELKNEYLSNAKEQDKYTDSLNKNIAAQIKLETVTEKTKKEKKTKEREEIIPFKSTLQPVLDIEPTTKAILKVRNEFGKLSKELIDVTEIKADVKIVPNADVNLVNNLPILDELADRYKKLTGEELVLPPVVTDEYVSSLKRALDATEMLANASGSAFSALAGDLASSLETGNSALDAFVGSVIQGFAQIAAAQLAGLIAKQTVATASLATDAAVSTGNAVTAASSTAAASGPAGAFLLPALVGAAIGFIAAAFSGIKFAHGGIVPGGSFTGDKIPAMLNSGEAVLNQQQQANMLMAIANGNTNSLQNNRKSSTFNLETKLRGADLLLAIKREERGR